MKAILASADALAKDEGKRFQQIADSVAAIEHQPVPIIPYSPPAELTALWEIQKSQSDQTNAIIDMTKAVRELADHAQTAADRDVIEGKKTWVLIGLTILIVVLATLAYRCFRPRPGLAS